MPDSGYAPPVMPSGTPPRSPGNGSAGLRRPQVLNSVDWWRGKAIQGAVIFLILFTPGLILVGVSQTRGDRAFLLIPGLAAILIGLGILAVYLLAPFTLKWIVIVPENHYWAVEDLRGMVTLGFLGEGAMSMQRKFNARIVPYVNFTQLNVTEIVTNVFDTHDLPVDIEVIALLRFDPTQADPQEYATLRSMIQQRQFEFEIRRQINLVVRATLGRLDPARSRSIQDTLHGLEAAVAEHLGHMAALGLQPVSARPVSAYIRTPRNIPDHIRRLWDRGANTSQESEMIRDIKEMMNSFGLTFEDAVRQYYLLKHGVQPPGGGPSTAPRPGDQTRYGQRPPFSDQATHHPGADQTRYGQRPPVGEETVFHPGGDQTRFGQHAPASEETVYHSGGVPGEDAAPSSSDAPAGSKSSDTPGEAGSSGAATRRTIRDVDDVPDPFDLRDNPGSSR